MNRNLYSVPSLWIQKLHLIDRATRGRTPFLHTLISLIKSFPLEQLRTLSLSRSNTLAEGEHHELIFWHTIFQEPCNVSTLVLQDIQGYIALLPMFRILYDAEENDDLRPMLPNLNTVRLSRCIFPGCYFSDQMREFFCRRKNRGPGIRELIIREPIGLSEDLYSELANIVETIVLDGVLDDMRGIAVPSVSVCLIYSLPMPTDHRSFISFLRRSRASLMQWRTSNLVPELGGIGRR